MFNAQLNTISVIIVALRYFSGGNQNTKIPGTVQLLFKQLQPIQIISVNFMRSGRGRDSVNFMRSGRGRDLDKYTIVYILCLKWTSHLPSMQSRGQ